MGRKAKNNGWKRVLSFIVFFIYMCGVIYFMFFSEKLGRVDKTMGYRYNLTPFLEIKRFYYVLKHNFSFDAILNLGGNVVAFIPFGMILPMLSKKKTGLIKVTVLTLLFSFTIESLQLFYKVGVFDIDDMILNTLGGIAGYIFYCIGKVLMKK